MDHRGKTGYSFNWTIMNLDNTQPIFFKVVILIKWSFLILLQGFSFAIYQAGARPCHSSNLHVLFVYAVINFTVGSILWYFVGYSLSFGPSQNVRLCWNPLTSCLVYITNITRKHQFFCISQLENFLKISKQFLFCFESFTFQHFKCPGNKYWKNDF